MKKELKELLESDILNEETKASLSAAIESLQESALEEAKKTLEVEYAEKFTTKKQEMEDKLTSLVNESVSAEIQELKEDIQKYRNLEVEYAQKLEEFKEQYAEKLEESVNSFIGESVKEEVQELKEDLLEAKKQNFGKKLFEAFAEEFEQFGVSDDVKKLRSRLSSAMKSLKESKETIENMEREKVMGSLLESLSGSKREVMKTILESVKTEKLEERYNEVIGSILSESDEKKLEEKEIVNESSSEAEKAEIERLRFLSGYKK